MGDRDDVQQECVTWDMLQNKDYWFHGITSLLVIYITVPFRPSIYSVDIPIFPWSLTLKHHLILCSKFPLDHPAASEVTWNKTVVYQSTDTD